MMHPMTYHKPVLLDESIDALVHNLDGIYVDATLGGGGHAKAILKRLSNKGKLYAFDTDPDAALQNDIDDERFVLIQQNFRYLKRFLRLHQVTKVDGILADLGVSSHQFDSSERGFSTRLEARLDMRMDVNATISAYEVVNYYEEEKLSEVLYKYGELKRARGMARSIVERRLTQPIETTFDLKTTLYKFLPPGKENKVLAQVFQAIRIEVNDELEVLKEFLSQTESLLVKGGRLCVISYHSLEDRLVKRFIRNGLFEGEPERDVFGNFEVPFKKVGNFIVPTDEEVSTNNRARSAKLRIGEKL